MELNLLNDEIEIVKIEDISKLMYAVIAKNKDAVQVKIDYLDNGIIVDALLRVKTRNKKELLFYANNQDNKKEFLFKKEEMSFVFYSLDNSVSQQDLMNFENYIKSELDKLKSTAYNHGIMPYDENKIYEEIFKDQSSFKLTSDHTLAFEFLTQKVYDTINPYYYNIRKQNLDYDKFHNSMKKNFNKSLTKKLLFKGAFIGASMTTPVAGIMAAIMGSLGKAKSVVDVVKTIFDIHELAFVFKFVLQKIYKEYKTSIYFYYLDKEKGSIFQKQLYTKTSNTLYNYNLAIHSGDGNYIEHGKKYYGVTTYNSFLKLTYEQNGKTLFSKNDNVQNNLKKIITNVESVNKDNSSDYVKHDIDFAKFNAKQIDDVEVESQSVVTRTMLYFKNNSIFEDYFKQLDIENHKGNFDSLQKEFEELFYSDPMQLQLKTMPVVKKYSSKEAKEMFPDEDPVLKSAERAQYHYVYDNVCMDTAYNANTVKCDENLFCVEEIQDNCVLRTEEWVNKIGYYYDLFDNNKDLDMAEYTTEISQDKNVEKFNTDINKTKDKFNKELKEKINKDLENKPNVGLYGELLSKEIIKFINNNIIEIENILLNSEIKELNRESFFNYIFDVLYESEKQDPSNVPVDPDTASTLDGIDYDINKYNLEPLNFVDNLYSINSETYSNVTNKLEDKYKDRSYLLDIIKQIEGSGARNKTQSIKSVLKIIGYDIIDPDEKESEYVRFINDFQEPLYQFISSFISKKELRRIKKAIKKEIGVKNNYLKIDKKIEKDKSKEVYDKFSSEDPSAVKYINKKDYIGFLKYILDDQMVIDFIPTISDLALFRELIIEVGKDKHFSYVDSDIYKDVSDGGDFNITLDDFYREILTRQSEYINGLFKKLNYDDDNTYPDNKNKHDIDYNILNSLYEYLIVVYENYIALDSNGVIDMIADRDNIKALRYLISPDIDLADFLEFFNLYFANSGIASNYEKNEIVSHYLSIGGKHGDGTDNISVASGKILVNFLLMIFYMSFNYSVYNEEIIIRSDDKRDPIITNNYIQYFLKTYVLCVRYVNVGKFDRDSVQLNLNIKKNQIKNLLNTTNAQSANIVYTNKILDIIKYYETKDYPVPKEEKTSEDGSDTK